MNKHVCSFISVTKISSAKARRVHNSEKSYSCSHCTNTFDHSFQWQRSLLQWHEELARNPTVVPTVQSRLITHLVLTISIAKARRVHTGEKSTVVPTVQSFDHSSQLQRLSIAKARRFHTGEKSFSYSHCKMLFSSYVICGDMKELKLAWNHRSTLFVLSSLSELCFLRRR